VRIQTVDPSAFEMPDAPANEAGVLFIFEGGLQEVRFRKRTLRGGRQSDASNLNEASEKVWNFASSRPFYTIGGSMPI
jgi:hypothetical protein